MTKEQREEQFREILRKATRGEIKQKDNVTSWGFMMDEKDIKKFLDFIESEVEKAKKEGFEDGELSEIAKLSTSENMEAIENFFREAPIDYDYKCRLWRDFIDDLDTDINMV